MWLWLACGSPTTAAEPGHAFVRTFNERDLQANQVNWAVAQGPDGIIYVANDAGLLSFDGARWRTLAAGRMLSLAVDDRGTVFGAGEGVMGYLSFEDDGAARFVDLQDRLPDGTREAGVVRQVVATPEGVYFVGLYRLHRWRWTGPGEGELSSIRPESKPQDVFSHVAYAHGRVIVARNGHGLLEITGEALTPIAGGASFADPSMEVKFILPLEQRGLLIGTLRRGVFRFVDGEIQPLAQLNAAVESTVVTAGARLANGQLVISTLARGVIVAEPSGEVIRRETEFGDLPAVAIMGQGVEDWNGGYWLPLSFGLARVEFSGSLRYLDRNADLKGVPLSVWKHGSALYVGTDHGLFHLDSQASAGEEPRFAKVSGGPDQQCASLVAVSDRLFAAIAGEIYEVFGDRVVLRVRPPLPIGVLTPGPDGTKVYGTGAGLCVCYRLEGDGSLAAVWNSPARLSGALVVEPNERSIWHSESLENGSQVVVRIALDEAGQPDGRRVYTVEDGLPASAALELWRREDRLFASTPLGLFRFEPDGDRFAPDPDLGAAVARLGGFAMSVEQDSTGGVWFLFQDGVPAHAVRVGEEWHVDFPFARAGYANVYSFYAEEQAEVIWAASGDGRLLRLDASQASRPASVTSPIISCLQTTHRKLFVNRASANPLRVALPIAENSLRFEYSLPSLDDSSLNAYQTRLVPHDEDWSSSSTETYRDYTALREGNYRFEVRGIDIYGRQSEVASFQFSIAPPWFRTWWSYTLYAITVLGGIYGLLRLREARSRRRMLQLQREIDERRRAERSARESESRFRALVDTTSDWVWEIDRELVITYSNERGDEIFGAASGSMIGVRLLDRVPPSEEARARMVLEDIVESEGAFSGIEFEFHGSGGRTLLVEMSGVPVRGETGDVIAYRGIGRDVTQRRRTRAEKGRLEAQLRQAQKMEAIGRLAGGISHDFNNILTVLIGHADIARHVLQSSGDREEIEASIAEVAAGAERAAALTSQLLAFSRQQVLQMKVLDPNVVVGRMKSLLERVIPSNVRVRTVLGDDVGCFKADAGQVEQVVLNLAINARDAMPDGGELVIETARVELDHEHVARYADSALGPYVMIAVSDTGVGIDPDELSLIFEPFYTTKELGKGTGLGLASTHGIVAQSGGHITVESEVSVGTTFRVYFPAVAEAPAPVVRADAVSEPGGNETVLVCDDDEAVVRTARKILQMAGYEVVVSANPQEAVEIAYRRRDAIDLLITDIIMPGMSGPQLAAKVRTLCGCRVLYISGYAPDLMLSADEIDFDREFLRKPFNADALVQSVRRILVRTGNGHA